MTAQNTTAAAVAAATVTPEQAAARRALIDQLAALHIAEGRPPMTGDDALLKVVRGEWTPGEAMHARCVAVEVEQAISAQQPAPAPHAWYEINGIDADLSADGRLVIRGCAPGADGRLELDSRAALGLLTFFRLPRVAEMIEAADAADQARREAVTLADLERARQDDAAMVARQQADDHTYAEGYAEGQRLGREALREQRGE